MKSGKVFVSPLSGRWHAAGAEALRRELTEVAPVPKPVPVSGVCAVVVPHAGYAYSGRLASEVYARLIPEDFDRVIVLAPSHHCRLRNSISVVDASGYQTPLGTSPADRAWLKRLQELPGVVEADAAHAAEHSDQIQLPLIQQHFGLEMPLVCIVVGQFGPQARSEFARQLKPLLDARTLVVASTDFTHYGMQFGYVPFRGNGDEIARQLAELDGAVFDAFASGDVARFSRVMAETGATVCGHEVLALLMELLPEGAEVTKTGYTTSGELTGDWSHTVSYCGATITGRWPEAAADPAAEPAADFIGAEDQALLLTLAREVVRQAAAGGMAPNCQQFAARVTPALQQKTGCFVTLTVRGRLRGCIGEILPERPLWQAVCRQAANAAIDDPRFNPLSTAEEPAVQIEISVLTPPQKIDSWRDIELGRHGVILYRDHHAAVFLPQVATEQGWSREELLANLALKAGLSPDGWRGAEFEVFEAQVFGEER